MAVRLRLMRMGKKKQPTYRIVAADKKAPRDGKFIEIVGTYDPREEPSVVNITQSKAVRWLSNGAQPSDRVQKLLEMSGAWDAFKSGTTVEDLEAKEEAAREAGESTWNITGEFKAAPTAKERISKKAAEAAKEAEEAAAQAAEEAANAKASEDEAPTEEPASDEAPAEDSETEES